MNLPGPIPLWNQKSEVESLGLAGKMEELLEKVGSQLENVWRELENRCNGVLGEGRGGTGTGAQNRLEATLTHLEAILELQ